MKTRLIDNSTFLLNLEGVIAWGGKVEHDEDAGTAVAFDPDGALTIRAIKKGSSQAPWIASYIDTEVFQWSDETTKETTP